MLSPSCPRRWDILTWTTYGSWLQGDRRGWISRLNSCPGAPINEPCAALAASNRKRLHAPPVRLLSRHRRVVEQAVREVCRCRGWELLAVNCRSNHVHLVVRCGENLPEKVLNALKAYSTRALREQVGMTLPRTWTRDGSKRPLWDDKSLWSACEYVRNQ
ncbi:MAG TPA: hypothetical protein DCX07_05630 [Phycisphaerales bacterium]|nr:hypothetical protein [Phycisphaerales bacterium]